jgi:hypothetical protein
MFASIRSFRLSASVAAGAAIAAAVSPLMLVPAQAAVAPLFATEITAPLDPIAPVLPGCLALTTPDTHAVDPTVPAGSVVELVVEGKVVAKTKCGGKAVYQIGQYTFAPSADTVDKNAPVGGQARVVARVNSAGYAVADVFTNRGRAGTATLKKNDVAYHLDGVWTAGALPGAVIINGATFNGSNAEADPGIAKGSTVTVQFTLADPALHVA